MQVKSVSVTDYSTGTQYTYSGSAGTWQSINAVGGSVNPSGSAGGAAAAPASTAQASSVVSASPSMPYPFSGTHQDPSSTFVTPSVYPWVSNPSTLQTAGATPTTTLPGLPSGWSVSSSGKAIPPSSATVSEPP